jgi:hypothetical protein
MVLARYAPEDRATQLLVWASIVLVVADVIAYLLLITAQGPGQSDMTFVVPFVASYLAVAAIVLRLSLVSQPGLVAWRPALRASAAAGLLVLGVLAAFSIGLPIFLAGVLAAIAAVRALAGCQLKNALLSQIAGGLIAVMVLVGGFEVTQRVIQCPPTGSSGGSGSGFLTGGYHYECFNGTLTYHAGNCNGTQAADSNGNATSTPC